ncbi:cytochrome c [Hymenobacter negativus]|uniref:Cytochrome c n=1 Tax=Hymenobacter negativus TaxID=2795026 RepID=A0ABS3QH18_9BACT|nr:cytochrome c [Hymenobacter negativus]MBO2010542.1 cytochrome c [Hymenobacter negativus]
MPIFDSFSAFIRPALVGTAALLLGLAASCTYSHGDPAPECDVANETITYARVISPIFDAHCRECHNTADANVKGAGYDFSNYQGINQYYSPTRMLGCIKRLPGYPPMPQNRDKLSDCDIQRIEAWIAAGKPNN